MIKKNHHPETLGCKFILCGWAMSQKPPLNNFEYIEDTSQFNEDLVKNIMKQVMRGIFSKLMFNAWKIAWTS